MLLNLCARWSEFGQSKCVQGGELGGGGVCQQHSKHTSSITGLQPIWKTNKNIKQTKRILEKYYYQINT